MPVAGVADLCAVLPAGSPISPVPDMVMSPVTATVLVTLNAADTVTPVGVIVTGPPACNAEARIFPRPSL